MKNYKLSQILFSILFLKSIVLIGQVPPDIPGIINDLELAHFTFQDPCDEYDISITSDIPLLFNQDCDICNDFVVEITGWVPIGSNIGYSGPGVGNSFVSTITTGNSLIIPSYFCEFNEEALPKSVTTNIIVTTPDGCAFEFPITTTLFSNNTGYFEVGESSIVRSDGDCPNNLPGASFQGLSVCCGQTPLNLYVEKSYTYGFNTSVNFSAEAGVIFGSLSAGTEFGSEVSWNENKGKVISDNPPCNGCNYYCEEIVNKVTPITFYLPNDDCSGYTQITHDYSFPFGTNLLLNIYNLPDPSHECEPQGYTDWKFDNAKKKCYRQETCNSKLVPNSLEYKDPVFIDHDFDESTSECITIYYCPDSDIQHTVREDAIWSDWQLDTEDEDNLVCYKELTCDNIGVPGVPRVEEDPEISWSYDKDLEKCIGTVECDGSEVEGYTIEKDPVVEIDWYYDDFSEQCKRVIMCDDTEFTEEMDPIIETDLSNCIITYICGDNTTEVPQEITEGEWELQELDELPLCFKKTYCGDEEQDESEWIFDSSVLGCDEGCDIFCPEGQIAYEYTCDDEGMGVCFCQSECTALLITSLNEINSKDDKISAFPNPFGTQLKIQFISKQNKTIQIELFNNLGMNIIERVVEVEDGLNLLSFKTNNNIPVGNYFLQIKSKDGIIHQQTLIKQ